MWSCHERGQFKGEGCHTDMVSVSKEGVGVSSSLLSSILLNDFLHHQKDIIFIQLFLKELRTIDSLEIKLHS